MILDYLVGSTYNHKDLYKREAEELVGNLWEMVMYNGIRDWSNAARSQGMPETWRHWKKPEADLLLEPAERNRPATPSLWLHQTHFRHFITTIRFLMLVDI